MSILQESIDEVRERTKIEDIVAMDVDLKPGGVDSLKGLCPFHDERTPSFHVRPSVGLWHCFGCDDGGDAIDYVQKKTGMRFAEAVEYLADLAGITLKRDDNYAPARNDGPTGQRLREANQAAMIYLSRRLADLGDADAAHARAFIDTRRIRPQVAMDWGAGYAPNHPTALIDALRRQGFTTDELVAAGLAVPDQRGGHRSAFRGRLTWAIRDTTNTVIGFGARRLDAVSDWGPKFLNTSETPLYKKSRVLFGVDRARKTAHADRVAYVVEGYTDVIAAHLAGLTSTVAPCGTAFTEEHMRFLHRTVGDDGLIVMCLDGDEAGLKGARRAFDVAQAVGHTRVNVVTFPAGKDPNDVLVTDGPEGLAAAMADQQPIIAFVLDATIAASPAGTDNPTDEDRIVGRDAVTPILSTITDQTLRNRYAQRAATRLGLPLAAVMATLTTPTLARTTDPDEGGAQQQPRPTARGGQVEREVIASLIHDEDTARRATGMGLTPAAFTTSQGRALMGVVVAALGEPTRVPWAKRLEEATPPQGRNLLNAFLTAPAPRSGADLDGPVRQMLAQATAMVVATSEVTSAEDLDRLAALRAKATGSGAF